VSTNRPAALDGSLLARKGDAAPAIPNDSPLLEELGEPRTVSRRGALGIEDPPAEAPGTKPGLIGRTFGWFAGHPVYGVLGLSVGIAILFGVTIVALTPPPRTVSAPPPPAPVSAAVQQKATIPTTMKSEREPQGEAAAVADKASERAAEPPVPLAPPVLPKPSAEIMPPEPPSKIVPLEPVVAAAPPKPPAVVSSPKPAPPPKPASTVAKAKPPAVRAAAAAPSGRSGRYLLQLSAVPTASSARREATRLEKRLGSLLGNRKIVVVKAVLPGKPPVYRLRAGSYETRAAARAACNRIKKKNLACIVVRG